MRNLVAPLAVTLASGVLCYACSSGQVSGLDKNKTLSSLTTQERKQYCQDHTSYMSSRVSDNDRKKITCAMDARSVEGGGTPSGSPVQTAAETCQDRYKACTDNAQNQTQPKVDCDAFAGLTESCPATVGEADDCAEGQAETLEKIAGRADDTCKNLDKPILAKEERASKMDACSRILNMCPKVYDALFNDPALASAMQEQPTPPMQRRPRPGAR